MKKKYFSYEEFLKILAEYDLKSVADASEVSEETLRRWLTTDRRPQLRTLVPVAEALGFEVEFILSLGGKK